MRFRPDDGYSKPTCGDRHSTTGFLLRVRIKKHKTTQAEDSTENAKSKIIDGTNETTSTSTSCDGKDPTENAKSKIIDSTNKTTSTSCDGKESLNTTHSKEDEKPKNTETRKGNHEDNTDVNNLIDQIHNCNVSAKLCIADNTVETNCGTNDTKNVCNININESLSIKNTTSFTFNDTKYENLSQNADYELPRLKILGRVDTEFKFTSMFST